MPANGRRDSLSTRSIGKLPSGSSGGGGGSRRRQQQDPLVVLQDILDYHSWGNSVPAVVYDDDKEGPELGRCIAEAALLQDMDIARDEVHLIGLEDEQVKGFETLHDKVSQSDELLKQVEEYMVRFRDDLSAVSADIATLQEKSQEIHGQIENRKALDAHLSKAVSELVVPPDYVGIIAKDSISVEWVNTLDSVLEMRKRINQYIESHDGTAPPQAAMESKDLIDLLIAKAVEKSRDFLISRIKSLRRVGVNAQNIQQQQFIKYKRIYEFLNNQYPQLSKEIGIAYVNTMKWYYASHFNRYAKALSRMRIVKITDTNLLLGANGGPNRSQFLHSQGIQDPLILGTRGEILDSTNHSVIKADQQEKNNINYWMETPFRSFNLALMENAAAEYQFIIQFFSFESPEHQANVFNLIFKKTFDLGIAYSKSLFIDSFDAIGILLCIRLCQNLQFQLQRRCIPVMENYLTLQTLSLWPRFQLVMDAHCQSINRLSSRSSLFTTTTTTAVGIAPHPITQSFASFIYGLLILSPEDIESEPVSISLVRLRNDFQAFLSKFCKNLQSQNQMEKFLYNNYLLISTIIGDIPGKLANQEQQHFKTLVDAYSGK